MRHICIPQSLTNLYRRIIPCKRYITFDTSKYDDELKELNTLRPRQNGRLFTDDIFKCVLLNENAWISIKISLKFVPKGLTNNIPALVQVMAWHWVGAKPLSESMMVSMLAHICVTYMGLNELKKYDYGCCQMGNVWNSSSIYSWLQTINTRVYLEQLLPDAWQRIRHNWEAAALLWEFTSVLHLFSF